MAHPFEVRKEIEVAATPDEVWEAIATGSGIDGWFLSTGNEVEPRVGGRMHMSFGEGESADSTVTAWEPPHRFAYSQRSPPRTGRCTRSSTWSRPGEAAAPWSAWSTAGSSATTGRRSTTRSTRATSCTST